MMQNDLTGQIRMGGGYLVDATVVAALLWQGSG